MVSRVVALSLLLAWTTQAARKISRKKITSNVSAAPPFSDVYTTYQGCTCKASSRCEADIGSLFKCDVCRTEGRCGNGLFSKWDYCDYRPSTVADFIERSWQSKVDYFWEKITADTSSNQDYPLLDTISIAVRTTFDNHRPEVPTGRPKVIHSMGSMCKFKLDITRSSPYTGIFSPGRRTGFIRLGSAVKPGDGITPGIGLKFPRSGVHDGDTVLLYSLGFGDGWDFFKQNQSNHLEPADGVIAIAAEKFKDASQCPYQVGLSDLARYSQDGVESNPPKFPFKVMAIVNENLKTGLVGESLDAMHSEIDAIPVGTMLYRLYACAEPKGDEMKPTENLEDSCGGALYLGDFVTTSQCTTSLYGDELLYFRHQRIEEDWQMEPSFMEMGGYDAAKACAVRRLTADGAPPICGQDGMLASDA